MTCVLAVYGNLYDSSVVMAGTPLCPNLLHQLAVAYGHALAVHIGNYSVTGGLLNIGYSAVILLVWIGVAQGHCYRMSGMTLHMCGQMQQFVVVNLLRVYCSYLKYALSQRSGLVKYDRLYIGQFINKVGTLYQYTIA